MCVPDKGSGQRTKAIRESCLNNDGTLSGNTRTKQGKAAGGGDKETKAISKAVNKMTAKGILT